MLVNENSPILIISEDNKHYVFQYKPKAKFSFHLGIVEFPENLSFGDILRTNKGYKVYILEPSNGDLMKNIRRRTNIIYPREAGYIITHTNIKEGSRIIETGTGSGALTVLLSRIVGKSGRIYSFDRRSEHLEIAMENVKKYGLLECVEFHLLDPSVELYPMNDVDCVIIDVPEPWTLVMSAYKSLRGGGFWASISPNIEQVIQTVEELKKFEFVDIKTIELFEREYLVRKGKTRPKENMIAHIGYLTFARKINKL